MNVQKLEEEIQEAWDAMWKDWYGYVPEENEQDMLLEKDMTPYSFFRRGWLAAKGYKYD